MDKRTYLGIYWTQSAATCVVLAHDQDASRIETCFALALPERQPDDQAPAPTLAQFISDALKLRQISIDEIFVALDSSMFTTHTVHSEFTSHKQIAQTIRFDAEEVLATDANEAAVAFKINSTDANGSGITIFAAQRKLTAEILAQLQAADLDPVAIEPDVAAVMRYARTKIPSHNPSRLLCLLTESRGHLLFQGLSPADWHCRTFIIPDGCDRAAFLVRHIPISVASFTDAEITEIEVLDSTRALMLSDLANKTNLHVLPLDLIPVGSPESAVFSAAQTVALSNAATQTQQLADSPSIQNLKLVPASEPGSKIQNEIDFAIAAGAVLMHAESAHIDFRHDFAPYQGRIAMLENALKTLSICVTVMLVAIGIYFQLRLFSSSRYTNTLVSKFQDQYKGVMFAQSFPTDGTDPVGKLKRELIRVRQVKQGQLGEGGQLSVSAMLTYIIETLNNASSININIDFINVDSRSIVITGDTAGRDQTLALIAAIDKHPSLRTAQNGFETKNGRDSFRITVLPKASQK